MWQTAKIPFLLILVVSFACRCSDTGTSRARGPVVTGGEALVRSDFEELTGKRVGLIANHTSTVDGQHLVDLLAASDAITLGAVFAPEHGFRGTVEAGLAVSTDSVNEQIPVFSLYGDERAPTAESLQDLDVLVFDIQDVGARFYTYISTLGLSMQAAAKAGKEFVVLDRPNPLGGNLVEGFVLEPGNESFVGMYPIPVVHGMTIGELAQMIKGEAFLDGLNELELTVVSMERWWRDMQWPQTGLAWVPTSPNIPDFETAVVYPGMCFLEASDLNEGRGTPSPFRLFGKPDWPAQTVLKSLQEKRLPGIAFQEEPYVPESIPGAAANPRHRDIELDGIRVAVIDDDSVSPVALGVHVLTAIRDGLGTRQFGNAINEQWMNRLAGTDKLASMLLDGLPADSIIASWEADIEAFREARARYLLYN